MKIFIRKSKPSLQNIRQQQIWLYLCIWILVTLTVTDFSVHGLSNGNIGRKSLLSSSPIVNCISHDSKYTCDCHNANEHMILPHLDGFVFHVEISNCRSLTIEANTLEETQGLRKITIKNIDRLILKQYALAFPRYASNTPLVIEFEKVNFEAIESHAINGNIEEIHFMHGSIEKIRPFAFTTFKDRAMLLKMDSVWVKQIDSQAFKKFSVDEMEITNCVFEHNIPSKTFYELEVLNALHINNNKFRAVHSHAFSFRMISKLFIINNYFESVDAEWFEAHISQSIVIRNNHFGFTSSIAFKGFSVHRDYVQREQMEFTFGNNSLQYTTVDFEPLEFNSRFMLSLKQLNFDNNLNCQLVDYAQQPPTPKSAFLREHMESIYFLPENIQPDANSNNNNNNTQSHVVLSQLIQTQCQKRSNLWIIIISIIGILFLLIVGALVAWFLWSRKQKRRKLDVVLPEPRTYKETQIVYQIENAGLLKTDL